MVWFSPLQAALKLELEGVEGAAWLVVALLSLVESHEDQHHFTT